MGTLAYAAEGQEQPAPRRWTREEYYRMADTGLLGPEDHVELIEGEIVNKMGPRKTTHAVAIRLMRQALRESFSPDFDIDVQMPISIEGNSDPEPDLSLLAVTYGGFYICIPRRPIYSF